MRPVSLPPSETSPMSGNTKFLFLGACLVSIVILTRFDPFAAWVLAAVVFGGVWLAASGRRS